MKKKKLFLIGVYLSFTQINAQEAIATSEGSVSGSNGSVSYTVGQAFYTTNYGTTASVMAGVQQPFEIQTILGLDNFNISLELSVYPNPTTGLLYLQVKESDFKEMHYQLFDMNGRLLENKRITAKSTAIQMERYPETLYLLKVIENNKEVKTFKIIKS